MDTKKRKQYTSTMNINGIHTLSLYADGNKDVTISPGTQRAVKTISRNKVRGKDDYKYYIELNPNTLSGSGIIPTFSQFQDTLLLILNSMGLALEDTQLARLDFCFNSTEYNSFNDYQKLHRLLLCCMAQAERFTNCYKVKDLWTDADLSISIRKKNAQAENYDKEKESKGKDISKNRLEIRSMAIQSGSSIKHELLDVWKGRVKNIPYYFEDVQERYTDNLDDISMQDTKKHQHDRRFNSVNDFTRQYRDCIFSRSQMADLFRMIGCDNAIVKANNFKRYYHIEYFNQTDLEVITKDLVDKLEWYMNN